MKIICVGRNYADHAAELNNAVPTEPVFFLKPETALPMQKGVFFLPSFSDDVHYEVELVVRINRVGKNIERRFAERYYSEMTVGIDFTARDVQSALKQKGLPWEKAKAFDNSAPIGSWVNATSAEVAQAEFELLKNGQPVQHGKASNMIFDVPAIVSEASRYFMLKVGDLIFTGTPAGVGPVSVNDLLEARLNGQSLLKLRVK